LQVAKELLPGARDGGAAVNLVGEHDVFTVQGMCAMNRVASPHSINYTSIPRRTSMCQ
ncbi:unnamed protein product, partial [Choristocarpus tenellus]